MIFCATTSMVHQFQDTFVLTEPSEPYCSTKLTDFFRSENLKCKGCLGTNFFDCFFSKKFQSSLYILTFKMRKKLFFNYIKVLYCFLKSFLSHFLWQNFSSHWPASKRSILKTYCNLAHFNNFTVHNDWIHDLGIFWTAPMKFFWLEEK